MAKLNQKIYLNCSANAIIIFCTAPSVVRKKYRNQPEVATEFNCMDTAGATTWPKISVLVARRGGGAEGGGVGGRGGGMGWGSFSLGV